MLLEEIFSRPGTSGHTFLKMVGVFVIREQTVHTCSVLLKLLTTFILVHNKERERERERYFSCYS